MDGHTLRARRRQLGLSQRELARRLGIPTNTLARWEQGVHQISLPRIVELALSTIASAPAASESVTDRCKG